MPYTLLAANECFVLRQGKWQPPVYDRLGVTLQVANLSTKIHRAVGAKKPPNDERLLGWCEDALDLENACRNWEKAAELRQSKLKRSLANRFTPAA